MNRIRILFGSIIFIMAINLFGNYSMINAQTQTKPKKGNKMGNDAIKSNDDWKKVLTEEQYHVLREKGTEKPFTGKYWNFSGTGKYNCAGCGVILFDSKTKFDAGCGWPSFYDVVDNKKVILKDDLSFGMHRIEVLCANCGSHLGHVFDDGPKPTGQRYCINSVSISFEGDK